MCPGAATTTESQPSVSIGSTYVRICTCTSAYMHAFMSVHCLSLKHTRTHIYKYVRTCQHIFSRTIETHTHLTLYVSGSSRTRESQSSASMGSTYVRPDTQYTYKRKQEPTRALARAHTHAHVHARARTHTHTHTHKHPHIRSRIICRPTLS